MVRHGPAEAYRALLADHLATNLDADADRLAAVLDAARAAGDPEVEVLTLDALARLRAGERRTDEAAALRAAADDLMPAAVHLLTAEARLPPRSWSCGWNKTG